MRTLSWIETASNFREGGSWTCNASVTTTSSSNSYSNRNGSILAQKNIILLSLSSSMEVLYYSYNISKLASVMIVVVMLVGH
jgi:hypothetical protein